MEPALTKHFESRPDRCGGKPCVAGTRIRVWDVYVWHELQGKSAEEIVTDFPQLTLADVHTGLAYYWDNRESIEREMKEAEDFVADLKAKLGPGPLAAKMWRTAWSFSKAPYRRANLPTSATACPPSSAIGSSRELLPRLAAWYPGCGRPRARRR